MNCKHLLAAALLITSTTAVPAQTVRAGIDAWQRGDYFAAVNIWRPLAERGDADAEFNLGQAYRLGRGVKIDLPAAKTWFERAANEGHVDAQTTLGLLLFQNNDRVEGLKWLKKAADHGEPRAQLVYGTALVNGDGIAQDPALGYAYVSRAAGQGLKPAQETLAQLETIVPLPERKRGDAIARELSKSVPGAAIRESKPTRKRIDTATVKRRSELAAQSSTGVKRAETASPKPVPAAAGGKWRIQLGAFGQKAAAEALFHKVDGKPALAGRQAFYVPVGTITRLQIGPYESKSAAQAACKAVGLACFPVPSN